MVGNKNHNIDMESWSKTSIFRHPTCPILNIQILHYQELINFIAHTIESVEYGTANQAKGCRQKKNINWDVRNSILLIVALVLS